MKGADFFMVPSIDLWDETKHTDEIPLEFTEEMEGVLKWGENKGLLAGNPDGAKLSIGDVAREWNTTMLREHSVAKGWTYFAFIVGAIVAVALLYCCARECWGLYKRRQMAETIATAIDARFSRRNGEEEVEMNVLRPTAPAPGPTGVPALTVATPMLVSSYTTDMLLQLCLQCQ